MSTAKSDALAQFKLDDQVAIITGGASGIGRKSADLFASVGAHVIVTDLNEREAHRAADEIRANGGCASGFALNIADEAAVERVFEEVIEQEGRIDILVCNAGTGSNAPATEMSFENWNHAISVNLTGTFLCARAAAKRMIERKNGGSIVITTSVMGMSGGGFGSNINYQASKGGLVNLTRGLAVEWADYEIRVNAVAPGWVRTPMVSAWSSNPEHLSKLADWVPLKRLAEPEEIASAILFLASPAASMVTGHTLPVDGGFLAK